MATPEHADVVVREETFELQILFHIREHSDGTVQPAPLQGIDRSGIGMQMKVKPRQRCRFRKAQRKFRGDARHQRIGNRDIEGKVRLGRLES